jgi:tetratricopeptide (TPR) repeat protein
MKREDNLRPMPVRRRRYVFGALCLPLLGIALVACGPDRPADTTTTTTASPKPSPTLDSATEARVARAMNRMSNNLYESELADANKALQTERNVSSYCRRAFAYEGLGKYDEAIADCNLAIGLDPRNSCGYENRASAYHKTRQHDLAIADYTKAISLDHEDPADLYHERGKIHQELRRYDAAIADYTKALKLDPENDEAYYSRGEAHYIKGELAKAKADLNRCLQNAVDTELVGKVRALLARIQEQSPEARRRR